MGKQAKGFGSSISSHRKKPSKQPKSKRIELNPLPDHECLKQKETRLKQILAVDDSIPAVSHASLQQYQHCLSERLKAGLCLTIDEPLDWEDEFIYGPGTIQTHQLLRKEQPSYLDQYQLISLEKDFNLKQGLLIQVQRVGDQHRFILPLYYFRIDPSQAPTPGQAKKIADYRFWWENYELSLP